MSTIKIHNPLPTTATPPKQVLCRTSAHARYTSTDPCPDEVRLRRLRRGEPACTSASFSRRGSVRSPLRMIPTSLPATVTKICANWHVAKRKWTLVRGVNSAICKVGRHALRKGLRDAPRHAHPYIHASDDAASVPETGQGRQEVRVAPTTRAATVAGTWHTHTQSLSIATYDKMQGGKRRQNSEAFEQPARRTNALSHPRVPFVRIACMRSPPAMSTTMINSVSPHSNHEYQAHATHVTPYRPTTHQPRTD